MKNDRVTSMRYETFIEEYNAVKVYNEIKTIYAPIIRNIDRGVYIWGTGKLGKYVKQQCEKNDINVIGFIDNNAGKWGEEKTCSADVLQANAIVIIASISYSEIAKQIDGLNRGIKHIYYEVLAKDRKSVV